MITKLIEQVDRLEKMIENLSEEEALKKSDDSSWSVCEIIEHMISVERGIAVLLKNNEGAIITDSSYYGKDKIESINQNMEARYKAPSPLNPKGRINNVEKGIGMLREVRTGLKGAIDSDKIQWNIEPVPHPLIGKMTKQDWLSFMTSHFERHLVQIERTIASVT